jgi:hypothetical protein
MGAGQPSGDVGLFTSRQHRVEFQALTSTIIAPRGDRSLAWREYGDTEV